MNYIKNLSKLILAIIGVVVSCFMGLLYAGFWGALVLGMLNTLIYFLLIKKPAKLTPLKVTAVFCAWSITGYLLMNALGLLHADERVHNKLAFIKEQLYLQGHNPQWIIISQKRGYLYNLILHWKGTAVKNSEHLHGNAIDVFVLDIDGDGTYTYSDYELMQKAGKLYDKKINRRGVVAHYFYKGNSLDKHMVHLHSL